MSALELIAILIFAATFFVVAVGRLPGFRVDRTGAALIGASLMVACGVLTLPEAYKAIDFDTLVLLLGMMIVVANLRLSGFFLLVNSWALRHAHRPLLLLATVVLVSGVFSAFLVNDTICLVLTPLVLQMIAATGRNPVPYLLAVALASNAGSVATITGNPQNMLIGSLSHIPYVQFTATLAPVAATGLLLTFAVLWFLFRAQLAGGPCDVKPVNVRYNAPMMVKAVLTAVAIVVAFFLGQPAPKVALIAGGFLLLTRRAKPEKIYREIDFPLLLLFAGLFVVVAGVEKTVLTPSVFASLGQLRLSSVPVLTLVSAVLSNLISNVPAVMVLKGFLAQLATGQHRAWLVLAMSSTLAGNFTIAGSVANLIVVQHARRDGIDIGFWEYFRAGAPVTILSLAAGILWLSA